MLIANDNDNKHCWSYRTDPGMVQFLTSTTIYSSIKTISHKSILEKYETQVLPPFFKKIKTENRVCDRHAGHFVRVHEVEGILSSIASNG